MMNFRLSRASGQWLISGPDGHFRMPDSMPALDEGMAGHSGG